MFKIKLNWLKKERIIPRWKLIGILFIAASFGFTLAISVQEADYFNVILIALCGILFTKNK